MVIKSTLPFLSLQDIESHMRKIADKIKNEESKMQNTNIDPDSDADSFEGMIW